MAGCATPGWMWSCSAMPIGTPSEYTAPYFHCRSYLSGFRGSAGTLVVGLELAGLWTDSRYFVEAAQVLDGSGIRLFRFGEQGVANWPEWLGDNLAAGAQIGCDPRVWTLEQFRRLESIMQAAGGHVWLVADPLATLWADRPSLPSAPVYTLPTDSVGISRAAKLKELRGFMRSIGAQYHVISALDEVAWLLNLRGGDVDYNPVVYAYLLVAEQTAELFIDERKVTADVRAELAADGVQIVAYDGLTARLAALGEAAIYFDPHNSAVALAEALPDTARAIEKSSFVRSRKATKNRREIEGFRDCMRKDGVALTRFFRWLEHITETGALPTIDEIAIARRLRELRSEQPLFVGESFAPIIAYGDHAAIVHYEATPRSNATLQPSGLLLIDSGGQYRNGTTDITRTIALGTLDDAARRDYTLVLQAHIALATLIFPLGTTGQQLDGAARSVVWRQGRSFGHGIGHGVGFFLPVHEMPPNIKPGAGNVIAAGMVFSNEPGLYRVGAYGIRHENLVVAQPLEADTDEPFMRLETLSLCYFDRRPLEVSMLTDAERKWLDDYHAMVYSELAPLLPEDERDWLRARTAPLS